MTKENFSFCSRASVRILPLFVFSAFVFIPTSRVEAQTFDFYTTDNIYDIPYGDYTDIAYHIVGATGVCIASGDTTGIGGLNWQGPMWNIAVWGTLAGDFLTSDKSYTLTCPGVGSRTVNLHVIPKPVITFTATPNPVPSGSPITLSWSSTNAISCSVPTVFTGGSVVNIGWPSGARATSGTAVLTNINSDRKYYLDCLGPGTAGNHKGGTSSQILSVTVTAPAPGPALDTTPPSTPTLSSANAISSSQISLSWTSATDTVGVTGYKIYRGGSLITTLGNVTSYIDSGLSPSTLYSYTVQAFDAAGNASSQSSAVSATTASPIDTTPPSAPAGLSFSTVSSNSVMLSWNASTDNVGVIGYKIYRGGSLVIVLGVSGSYQDSGLSPGTAYSYTVQAFDAGGNASAQSNASSVTTSAALDNTPPSVPTNFSASAVSSSQVNLSWNASTDNVGVVGYRIYRGPVMLLPSPGAVTSYTDPGSLSAGTTYSYTIQAVDAAGNMSAASASVSATTQTPPPVADTTAPTVPNGLSASSVTQTSFTLSWNPSSDASGVTGYKVFKSGIQIAVTVNPSYPVSELSAGTTYAFTVTANDVAGNTSSQSNSLSVTTSTAADTSAPSVPTGVSAAGVSGSQVNVSWNASTDNVGVTGYKIYRGGALIATLGNVTTYQNTGLSAGTSYTYTFQALDAAGNASAQSSSSSAMTSVAPDATAPSIPASLSAASITQTSFTLSWAPATDAVGVTGYKVFRGGLQIGTPTSNSFSVTGLSAGTSYSLTVSAVDAAGNTSSQSNALSVTTSAAPDTAAPSVPTGLSKTTAVTTVTLSWNVSTDTGGSGLKGYYIYRNGVASPLTATPLTLTTYTDSGLSALTTYTYSVSAIDNSLNESSRTSVLTVSTLAAPDMSAPSTPANLSAAANSATQVTLNWTGSTDNVGVTGYKVFRSSTFIATVTNGTSYTDTGLSASTAYTYTVSATDAAGNTSAQSASAGTTTNAAADVSKPSTPANLTATAVSSAQINLSWSASSDNVGVIGYKIFRGGVQMGTSVTTSFTSSANLLPNTSYTYTVSAYDLAGNDSSQSASASATTLALPDTIAPSTPTGLSVAANSTTQITLLWNTSTDNVGVTGYKLFRNGVLLTTTTGVSTVDANLTPATSYSYKVAAFDAIGNTSSQSVAASATTNATDITVDTVPPSVPGTVTGVANSPTRATIYWNASTDNVDVVGYTVNQSGVTIATITGTTYQAINLSPETTYSYVIKAFDAANNFSPAGSVTVTTFALPVVPVVPVQPIPDIPVPQTVVNTAQTITPVIPTRTLALGDSGQDVRALQQFLNQRGFTVAQSGPGSPGNESTVLGPATSAAIARFQQSQGIVASTNSPGAGKLGPVTLQKIVQIASGGTETNTPIPAVATPNVTTTTSAPAPTPVATNAPKAPAGSISVGSTGADVKTIQQFLNSHGFIIAQSGPGSPGNESTYFGPATSKAISRFQEVHAAEILAPAGLKKGTGYVGPATKAYIQKLMNAANAGR